jgi:hypothetical protein
MQPNTEENLTLVRQYLEDQFPDYKIEDERHSSRDQIFTVHRNKTLHRARFTFEFLADYTPMKIGELLGVWNLADALRDGGSNTALVTTCGIRART